MILTSSFLVLLILLSSDMALVAHHCRDWVTVNRKFPVEVIGNPLKFGRLFASWGTSLDVL